MPHKLMWVRDSERRSFDGEARKIAQLLNQMTRDLGGRRDLSKLSPWLANYSPGAATARSPMLPFNISELLRDSNLLRLVHNRGRVPSLLPVKVGARPFHSFIMAEGRLQSEDREQEGTCSKARLEYIRGQIAVIKTRLVGMC